LKYLYNSEYSKTTYDAIIIGSGIGGLTAASFLAKAGKKVIVLEQHYVPGGLTHTFKRKNFVWDVGVHYVGQVHKQKELLRQIFDYVTNKKLQWTDMGEIYDRAIIDGDVYDFKAGLENQIAQMIQYFPDEEVAIRKYYKLVKKVSSNSTMFFSERTMPRWLSKSIGPLLKNGFYKYSDLTTYEVIRKLTSNEKLISVLCTQCGNYGLPPKKSSFAIHAMIVDHFLDGGNYPVGGASSIHKTLTDAIEAANGIVAIKASVKKIIVENNKAIGVEMQNGDTIYGKKIISNAGAHNTFNKLINSSLINLVPGVQLNDIKPSVAHVCLYVGLNKNDTELNLPKNNIWFYKGYDFDSNFNQHIENLPGESPIAYISFPSAKDPDWIINHPSTSTIQVVGSFPFAELKKWENEKWQKRGDEYEKIKDDVKNFLLQKLLSVVPQIKDSIEYLELSTPLSTQHFTNYSQGEIYGLEHTPQRFRLALLRPQTAIKNLYLTGQDVVCVGVGAALFSGLMTAVAVLNRNLLWRVMRN
jgi:all-trans-retinol 13,14-reductase